MQINIENKVTVVTGAGRGIGEVVARRFAEEGARLVLLDRDRASLEQVASMLQDMDAQVERCVCDVSDHVQVQNAIDQAVDRFGSLDVLINNAGVALSGTVEEMDIDDWEQTFATNSTGVFLCSRAVIPIMKRQGGGRIINASSFAAIIPSFAFAAYSASKAAVASFTRVLAAELGPWDVTVNAYAPGMIPTAMNRFDQKPPEQQQQLLDTLCLRRWGTAEDVASLLIFLASDMARYITGTTIDVSGGKYSVQFPKMAYESA